MPAVAARRDIGLTGDVGSGKTTVRRWLAERGAATLDADEVVRRLLRDDRAVVESVIEAFGPEVRAAHGAVDRARLAAVVFEDAEALRRLEAIVHPVVRRVADDWLGRRSERVRVVEAVKLVESGMHEALDELWLVVCDRAVRRRRLAERGWDAAEIGRRMAAAAPLRPRLALADVVIDNTGPSAATEVQLERAWAAGEPGSTPGGRS